MPNIVFNKDNEGSGKDPKGTLFPEIGGGGALGEAEIADDITGVRLPGLTSNDGAPGVGVDGSSLSSVPQILEGQDAPPPATVIEDTTPQKQKEGRPRTARDRIAQLTKRRREAEAARDNANSGLNQVLSVVQEQGKIIQEMKGLLASRGTPAPAATPTDDPLGIGGEASAQPGAAEPLNAGAVPLTAGTIRTIMTEAIQAYDQQRTAKETAQGRLAAEQELSFQQAAAEMPELNDANSEAFKNFSELYNHSPLCTEPDGPYQIAMVVRGLMADERAGGVPVRSIEDRTRHASLPPRPSATPLTEAGKAGLKQRYDKVRDEIKRGNNSFELYKEMRLLGAQLRQGN